MNSISENQGKGCGCVLTPEQYRAPHCLVFLAAAAETGAAFVRTAFFRVCSTTTRFFTAAAWADPEKPGGVVGANAAGAAKNTAVRSGIRNLPDMEFLLGIGTFISSIFQL
jgi:hypothetical protein